MSKLAIVTGATKGIGLAIATQLQEDGYMVYGTYVSSYSDQEIAVLETESFKLFQVDAKRIEACTDFMKKVDASEYQLEVLVNNAGVVRDQLLIRMSESEFDDVIETNLKGVFNMTQACSKTLIRKKKGSIVNISSVVGLMGNSGQANYAASKAGVIGFSKSLAREFASRNVRVNCIAPGFIETAMTDSLSGTHIESIKNQIALGRLGKAEDIANAVSFLVSDKANYITGQTLNVCGGMVM